MSSNDYDISVSRINDKLEQRLNGLQIFRLSLMNISKIEELRNERNEILKYFFELEEDLRQVNNIIKTLSTEKNKLLDHIKSNDLVIKRNELKQINRDKDIQDLNNQIQDLINFNRVLNEKSHKADIEIKQLRESIKLYEDQLSKKQLELENLEISNKMNSYNLGYHLTNEKNTLFMQTHGNNNSQINSRNDKETLNNVLNDYLNSQKFNNSINHKLDRGKGKQNINKESDLVIQGSPSKGAIVDISYKKENKIGKLVGLLVKIKNSIHLKNYCSDKLEKDFMQKLLSQRVSENFLEKVESVVNEYFKLHEKDQNNKFSINKRKGNSSLNSKKRAEKSTNRSSNFKFSGSDFDEVKSIRSLKSSLSFSKLKNESFKNRDSYTQGRNKSSKSNKVYDFKETTSWASLKDYFNYQQ